MRAHQSAPPTPGDNSSTDEQTRLKHDLAVVMAGNIGYGESNKALSMGEANELIDSLVEPLAGYVTAHLNTVRAEAEKDLLLDAIALTYKKPDEKWGKNRAAGFEEGLGYIRAKLKTKRRLSNLNEQQP